MKLWISLVALFSCAFSSSRSPTTSSAIDQIRLKYGVPALAVMVMKDGKMRDSAFTGVRKIGDPTPISASDQFHLGSDTKAMTATVIGMLVDDGKLQWSSKLEEFFPNIDPGYKSVTIEMVSSHWAGVPSNPEQGAYWDSIWGMSAVEGRKVLIENILKVPPANSPGSKYSYSNMGYVILGAIIEKISSKNYEDVMQERLFSKLGMQSCGFGPVGDPLANPPDEPWGHELKNGALVSVAPTLLADNPPGYNSAARVHCSLTDWGKFLQMHVDGFNGKAGLVSVTTFKKLHSVHPGGNYTYGGWQLDNREWANGPVLHHEGSNTMNVAQVWVAPLKNEIFMSATNGPLEIGRPAVSKAIDYLIHH